MKYVGISANERVLLPVMNSRRIPISCFIIAKDEADRIGPVIRSVRDWVDEVVLVDSGSTDGTQELARELGARVIANGWPGYGPQKRFAEEQCRNNWLLNIDADESVTPELADEIQRIFSGAVPPSADGYKIRIVELLPGEDQPGRFAYTLTPVRLYRRDRGRYAASTVHDRVAFPDGARLERLHGIILHRSIRSLAEQLSKLDRYSTMQADDFVARDRRLPLIRVYAELPAAFLKAWI